MRYVKLYLAFMRNCLIREMEARGNFFAGCLVIMVFPFLPLLFAGAIFSQVSNLGGWTFHQYLVLAGTFQIISGFVFAMFFGNIFKITEYVRKGELDFFLLKPVNSQFMLTTRYVSFTELAQMLPGIVLLWIGLANLNSHVEWWQWPLYLVFIVCGVVIAYSIWFMSALPTIWWVRLEAPELFFSLFDVARYHPTMFGGLLRTALVYVLPLGVIAATPADWLLGRLSWQTALWTVFVAALLLFLSNRFWRYAQNHYYGASA